MAGREARPTATTSRFYVKRVYLLCLMLVFFSRLLFIPLVLTAMCQPPRHQALPTSMKQLEGTWLNSYEENRGDTIAYRPNTYAFPPSRGRTGFAIKPYGRFVQFDIAPTDGLAERPGTWTAEGATRLRIHLEDNTEPDYTLEVVALENGLLRVVRR